MRNIEVEKQRQQETIDRLTDALEEATPQTGVLEELESQLKEHTETLEMNVAQYDDLIAERARINAEQKTKKKKMDAIQAEINEFATRITKAERRLEKAQNHRDEVVKDKNSAFAHLARAEQSMVQYQSSREEQLREVEDYTRQASAIVGRVRVDPGETGTSIETKLTKLQEDKVRHERA